MKHTVTTVLRQKTEGNKITMLTAYDYSTAKLMDETGIEVLLVGDSLGNTILGYADTLSVTMEDMKLVPKGEKLARILRIRDEAVK